MRITNTKPSVTCWTQPSVHRKNGFAVGMSGSAKYLAANGWSLHLKSFQSRSQPAFTGEVSDSCTAPDSERGVTTSRPELFSA